MRCRCRPACSTSSAFPPCSAALSRPVRITPAAINSSCSSYGLWQRRFGADPGIVGRAIAVDGRPRTVVGVMPADFRFAPFWQTRAELWAPLSLDARRDDRDGRSLRVFARLAPGVTVAQAQQDVSRIAGRLEHDYPGTNTGLSITVRPLMDKVVAGIRGTLIALLAMVVFVLLMRLRQRVERDARPRVGPSSGDRAAARDRRAAVQHHPSAAHRKPAARTGRRGSRARAGALVGELARDDASARHASAPAGRGVRWLGLRRRHARRAGDRRGDRAHAGAPGPPSVVDDRILRREGGQPRASSAGGRAAS